MHEMYSDIATVISLVLGFVLFVTELLSDGGVISGLMG